MARLVIARNISKLKSDNRSGFFQQLLDFSPRRTFSRSSRLPAEMPITAAVPELKEKRFNFNKAPATTRLSPTTRAASLSQSSSIFALWREESQKTIGKHKNG